MLTGGFKEISMNTTTTVVAILPALNGGACRASGQ